MDEDDDEDADLDVENDPELTRQSRPILAVGEERQEMRGEADVSNGSKGDVRLCLLLPLSFRAFWGRPQA